MPRHRRTRVTLILVAALLLVAAVAAACSAQASGDAVGGSSSGGPADGSTGGSASAGDGSTSGGGSSTSAGGGAVAEAKGAKAGGSDLDRVLAALAYMRATTPDKPVVVLLGGSAARESTIDDGSWRDQIVAKGGPRTLAWNMGSTNRTLAQNIAIVEALPEGADALVYIGVNLGAFTSSQKTARITLPAPAPESVSLQQFHKYSTKAGILSTTRKKALVREWLSKRYPVFKANFTTSAGVLNMLIQACKDRGYRPVLLELPRNSSVIGSSLSAPTTRYRERCKRLAAKHGIKWVPQLANLPNRDFYDLWHLVEPGRTVWQDKLSAKTAYLLELYGIDGGS